MVLNVGIGVMFSAILVLSLIPYDYDAFALSCPPGGPPLPEGADAIFNGKVISKNSESESWGGIKVQFQVDQSYKGRIHGLVNITTSPEIFLGGGFLGGDPFTISEEYFVFAIRSNGDLYVDNIPCGSSYYAFPVSSWNKIKDSYSIPEAEILPPKHQISNNVSPEEIICKKRLQLIFKSTDGSPACVKEKSVKKIIERGWATLGEVNAIFIIDKSEYKIGEEIKITLKNVGHMRLITSNKPVGFIIYDEDGEGVKNYMGILTQISSLPPQMEITRTWDQKHGDTNQQVPPGNYTLGTTFRLLDGNTFKAHGSFLIVE